MDSSATESGVGQTRSLASDDAPATRKAVQWLGLVAAVAGVEHGIGEVGQGWSMPPGLVFDSWAGSTAFEVLGGEPAMSVIPNYVIAGMASIAVALMLGAWCTTQLHRRSAGLVIIGLSVMLLLVGGGFGPPIIGVIVGAVASRIGAVPGRWTGPRSLASSWAWRWALATAVVGFLTLMPGLVVLAPVLPADNSAIVAAVTVFAFAATVVALTTARAHDRGQPPCL